MQGNIKITTQTIQPALRAECTKLGLSYIEEDTNADLCTKIDNFNNA